MVLGTPVLAITLLLLAVERVLHVGIFDPALGGDPVLFQHLFWFYSHPAVYIMILPAMGVISEIVACFSRKNDLRLHVRRVLVSSPSRCSASSSGATTCSSPASRVYAGAGLLDPQLPRRDPLGDQGLQLDGDAVQGVDLAATRRCSTPSASSACSRSAA